MITDVLEKKTTRGEKERREKKTGKNAYQVGEEKKPQ